MYILIFILFRIMYILNKSENNIFTYNYNSEVVLFDFIVWGVVGLKYCLTLNLIWIHVMNVFITSEDITIVLFQEGIILVVVIPNYFLHILRGCLWKSNMVLNVIYYYETLKKNKTNNKNNKQKLSWISHYIIQA